MSSKKSAVAEAEGEPEGPKEAGAAPEEPDEEVEGMKAALTVAQREDLKNELEHEVALLTIKNISLKEKIGKVEKEMTKGISSREEVIQGESETTKTMGEEAAALDAAMRLEQDALGAALAARQAAKALTVAEGRAKVEALRAKLEDLKAFQKDHDRLLLEIRDVQTRQDAFEAQFLKKVNSMTATMEANAVRWAGEMESRSNLAKTNLQAKVERDVFKNYHTIQNEHSRMRTELGYQQHRMQLIEAANACVLRRIDSLEAKIASERKLQDVMSRCIRYHKRIIARNRGSTVSLFSKSVTGSLTLGSTLGLDETTSLDQPDSFAPPEEGDDLSLGQSFLGRPVRPSTKSPQPIKHRSRNHLFYGFAARDQPHRRPREPDD